MRQQIFENRYQQVWRQLERLLEELQTKKKQQIDKEELRRFPTLYRQTCYHYALAKTRQYSPQLVEHLHSLVMNAHQYFYRTNNFIVWQIIQFVLVGFPQSIRENAKLIWLSSGLLFGPAIVLGLLCYFNSDFIYTLVPEHQVVEYEAMYNPSAKILGRARESTTNFMMFGFYIEHNISIGFRTFAGGLLLGIGTILSLLFNGLIIGAIAGHLTQLGYITTFWPFVSGHSAFELTAICITGAAGLRLSYALFAPGKLRRIDALKQAANEALPLVIGAAGMLVVAAFIEAFWSSSTFFAPTTKYTVAGILWALVILYFTFVGRGYARR
ncbi:stage II sporulation protein M [Kaarinaea lacus]